LLLWDASGLDLQLTRGFGTHQGFVLRHAWWTERLLHDGARQLAILLALLWALGVAWPRWQGPSRRLRAFWLLVAAACWSLVPAIKRFSQTSCPWDMAEFGGQAQYVPHTLWTVFDGGPGHCFPSGHATTAFGFLAWVALWWPYRPRLAQAALAVLVVAGGILGTTQLARGAHHLSQGLWSAWMCLAVVVLAQSLAQALSRPARRHLRSLQANTRIE
jgi:membrane-associated PAP2 superfamily phosphatase